MRFSTILSAYIGRAFLGSFFVMLVFIIGLILLGDTIELMRRMAPRQDATFGLIMTMALLKLPSMVHLVMPFAIQLGSMVVFWRLTRSHELVVARAAGVSVWQFLMPVLVLALAIGIFDITAFNPLSAALHARYEAMEENFSVSEAAPLSVGENGLWLREVNDGGTVVVHAALVHQEGLNLRLKQISIMFVGQDRRFTHRIEAPEAVLSDGQFRLRDAYDMYPGKAPQFHATATVSTRLTPERIEDNFASAESISFWELPAYIAYFEQSGFSAHKQRLHYQLLLASPLLLGAMVLVAAVFSLRPNLRSGGMLRRFGGGVVAGLLFYFFSNVVNAMGGSQSLPLLLAAWSPPALTGLAGLALLFHLEDG
jgi:lipopolysaccharide export system permease protein